MNKSDDLPFDIMYIVNLIGIQVKKPSGHSVYANCPFCTGKNNKPDTHGHMNINLQKNVWRCNRCGRGGGKLALYAEYYGIDTKEAYRQLSDNLPASSRITQPKQVYSPPVPEAVPVKMRHVVYTELLNTLKLAAVHRDALRRRGLSDEAIDRAGYKSAPLVGSERITERLIRKGMDVECVPGFYYDSELDKWDIYFPGSGILIPVRNRMGMIQGMQIRMDQADKCKYLWISSNDLEKGVSTSSFIHVAGPVSNVMYLTEGPLKSDIAHHLSGISFIAVAGVTALSLLPDVIKELKKLGTKMVTVAYDMDKTVNPNVAENLLKLHDMIEASGLKHNDFDWDWQGKDSLKGIDDYFFELKKRNV